jgi:hypothetical protein
MLAWPVVTKPPSSVDPMAVKSSEKVIVSFSALVDVEVDLGAGTISATVGPPLDASRPESITLDDVTVMPDGLLGEDELSLLSDSRVVAALEQLATHDWQTPFLVRTQRVLAAPLVADLHRER